MKQATKRLLLSGIIIGAGVIFSACQPTEGTPPITTQDSIPSVQEVQNGQLNQDDAEIESANAVFVIDSADYVYEPSSISASAGDTVLITLTNSGNMPHDFVIDELGVQSALVMPGEEAVVSFTIPETAAGTQFEYYCSIGDHRARGMVGTLAIVD